MTRLRATEESPGWAKITWLPASMLKPSQWMITRSVAWSIRVVVGSGCEIVASPCWTCPPSWAPAGSAIQTASSAAPAAARIPILP